MQNTLPIWNSSPLDQFIIRDLFSIKADILGNLQISLTNMGLYIIITTVIIFMYYLFATNYDMKKPNLPLNKKSCIAILFSLIALFALILYISYTNHLLNEFIVNLKDFDPYLMECPSEESDLDHEIFSFFSRPGSNTPNLVDSTSNINANAPDLVSDTTVPDNLIRHKQYIKHRIGFSGNYTMGVTSTQNQNCINQVNHLKYHWNQGSEIEKGKLQIALMETGKLDIINNYLVHKSVSGGFHGLSSRAIASLSMTHYDLHNSPIGGLNGVDLNLYNNVYNGPTGQYGPASYGAAKPWLIRHLDININDKRVELAALEQQESARIKDALSINKIINK